MYLVTSVSLLSSIICLKYGEPTNRFRERAVFVNIRELYFTTP